ncbi:hypothetical protein [Streptomyces sp. WMMB 322]|nr:hypothetical protein [Streptomyces sp. WMMB 322]
MRALVKDNDEVPDRSVLAERPFAGDLDVEPLAVTEIRPPRSRSA